MAKMHVHALDRICTFGRLKAVSWLLGLAENGEPFLKAEVL